MNNITFDSDRHMTVLGVEGRLTHRTRRPDTKPGLWFMQRWVSQPRPVEGFRYGGTLLTVEMRYDDELKNGHNAFTITATAKLPGARDIEAGGCMHEDIAKVFPELEPLIKWHLCYDDGPMHYLANTVYHAGDRDYNGLKKGEVRQIRNGRTGKLAWQATVVDSAGKEVSTPSRYFDADEQPTVDARFVYVPWTRTGEGKERDFAAARHTAVWPEATDEQLSAEPDELRAMLTARLPKLLADFRAVVESTGLWWEPPVGA